MKLSLILSKFLNIPQEQAETFLDLIKLESFQIEPSKIKSQRDFIDTLQEIGQKFWFKGHDRSKFDDADPEKQALKNTYMDLFKKLGLFEELKFNAPTLPPCLVVLGSSQTQVKTRTQTLIDVLKNTPTNVMPIVVFGLGSNRLLGNGVTETEEESSLVLEAQGKERTEANMVDLIVTQALDLFKQERPEFSELISYRSINTIGAPDRASTQCVKTSDTAGSLKENIEQDPALKDLPKPIELLVFSQQPFAERQRLDVAGKMDSEYKVDVAARGVNVEEFVKNPKAINICLGEAARLLNIAYTSLWKKLSIAPSLYDTPLTEDEQNELAQYFFIRQKPASSMSTANSSFFYHDGQKESGSRTASVAELGDQKTQALPETTGEERINNNRL